MNELGRGIAGAGLAYAAVRAARLDNAYYAIGIMVFFGALIMALVGSMTSEAAERTASSQASRGAMRPNSK